MNHFIWQTGRGNEGGEHQQTFLYCMDLLLCELLSYMPLKTLFKKKSTIKNVRFTSFHFLNIIEN